MHKTKKHAAQVTQGYLSRAFKKRAILPLVFAITATFAESAAAVEDTTPPTFTIAPADGSTGIAVDSNITITASERIMLEDGTDLNDTNVDTVIVLKDFSLADIPFDATISGYVITINPTTDFSFNQWVYVAINVPDGPNFTTNPAVDLEGNLGSASANFTTIAPPNSAPTADAGADQTGVASGASVTLDGTGSSDPDVGDVLSYAWTQTAGTTVSLSSTTASQPSFTAPTLGANDAAVTLTFSLVVTDDKSNSSAADTVDITVNPPAPTPASEFERYEAEIREVVMDDAERSLQSTVTANRRMTNDARERFIASRQATDEDVGLVSRNNVPFDVDGTFAINNTTLSTSGSFFEQTGNYEGTQRRLFFGNFDVQHDGDTGSTTATLTARVVWEQMTSDRTMLGYFIGGELAHSNIDGAFEGDQDRIGVTLGGYAVHQLADQVYLDGFLTLGAGRNNLDMANDVLELESDYTTLTATVGAALSGVYEYEQYEFRPELAFSYGQTWIGNVGFTGRAYGLVDDTLSLDGGNVSIASLTLRPEIVWALDADTVADSNSQLSFAPRLICERSVAITRTENCGGGAEIGLSSTSDDGLSNAEFRVIMDRVGNSARSSLAFNLELRF